MSSREGADMNHVVSRLKDAATSAPKITKRVKAKETREPGVEGV